MKQINLVHNSKVVIGLFLGLKSRIHTYLPVLTMLMMLMVALFGVNENAWADCNYTFNDGATYTFYGEHYKSTGLFNSTKHYKVGKDGYVTIGSIDNTYGISHVQATGQFPDLWTSVTQNFTLQYKVDNGDWVTLGSAATIGKKSSSIYNQDVEISGGANQKVYFRLLCADPNSRFSDSQRFTISITVRKATTASMPSTLSVGSVEVDATSNNTKSFNFKHSNRNGQTITFSSDQSAFTVSPSSVTLACSGTETITVTYSPTCNNKPTSATITAKYGNNTLATMTASASSTLNDQTVTWNTTGKATSLVAGDTLIIGGYASSSSTIGDKPAIRYTSSNTGVIRVSGDTLFAVNGMAGQSAVITANQDADCKYAYAYATQTFQVTDKAVPTFTLYINNVAQATKTANLKVGDVVEIHCTNAPHLQLAGEDNTIFEYSVNGDKSVVTVTAKGEHANAKLTVSETGNTRIAALSEDFTFNISKHVTDISSLLNVNNFYVGNSAYNATECNFAKNTAYSTNNDDVTVQFSSTNENVIALKNGKITAKAAGDATIKMWQAPTNKWTGDTVTQAITVKKHAPTFGWNVNANYTWNQSISNPFTTDNHDTQITCVSDDTNVADYVDGKVVIYNVSGTAHFTLSQAENDVWKATSQQYTVTVSKPNNHVTFTYSGSGNMGPSKGNESDIIEFTGVPSTVTCNVSSDASANKYYYLFEADSPTGTFTQVGGDHENGSSISESLSPSTRAIKFKFDGAWNMLSSKTGTFSNITITERREVKPHETADVDCGSANHGSDPTTGTAVLEWYNVKPLTCWITSEHPEAFELVTTSIVSQLDTHNDNEQIIVRGKHDVPADTYTGTLHVSNGIESTTFNLTTATTKQTPVISWKNNLSPLSVGDVVTDAASAGSALIHYTVDGSYLTLNEQGAVVATNATDENGVDLIAYVAEDETWYAQSDTIKVVVTNLEKQTINWTDKFSLKFMQQTEISLTASASSSLPIKYELSGTGTYAHLNADSTKLVITGIGKTLYLTAKQAGNAEYYQASQTKLINSRDPNATCDHILYEDYSETTLHTIDWKNIEWNLSEGEPGRITFKIKRMTAAVGNMAIEEYYDGSWHRKETYSGLSTSYGDAKEVTLNRKTTKISIGAPTGATLQHYVKDIVLHQAKYIEGIPSVRDFGTVTMGTEQTMTFDIKYSNLSKSLDLEIKNANSHFSVDRTYIGDDCGEHGTVTVTVTYTASEYRNTQEIDSLIISNSENRFAVALKANVQKASQTITWNPNLLLNTTDVIAFDAVTTDAAAATGIEVKYEVTEGNDVATVTEDGHLTIIKNGTVKVKAYAEGNSQYEAASDVEKTFTISKVTPTIINNPTINAITLPATLSNVTIGNDATAEDDKHNAVTGSFAWQAGSTKVLSGANEYVIVFTPNQPTGKDWYNEVVYNISVTGNKGDQFITWTRDNVTSQPCSTPTTFDASSNRGLAVTYESDDESIARVDKVGNEYHLVVLTSGTVHITAKQPGNGDYNTAEDVTRTITLTREQPVITTPPTADEIFTDNLLLDAGLSGGEGQVNGVHAEGIFAWKNGDVQPEYGTHTYTATFTPSPAAWYYPAECQVSVTVNKHPHSLSWSYAGGTISVDKDDLYFSGATSSVELTNIYYTTSDAAVAEVDAEQGNKLIIHGKGTIEVIARSEGDANYEAAELRRTLTILPLTTTVTVNPAAAEDITYGQALSATTVIGGTVKGSDDAELDGTWAWNEDTEILNAGQNQSRGVTFTPSDDHWYAMATTTATVNVNKATPTLSWATALTELAFNATNVEYRAASASDGSITYAITAGSEYAHIDANTGVLTDIVPGHTITIQASQAVATNYNAPEAITVDVVIADAPLNEFTNASGDGDWSNPENWSSGIPAEIVPDVIISGALEIKNEDVTVGNLTIENTGSITVITGGTLTVTGESEDRIEYGDIHVKDDGALALGDDARLEVRHFTLDAALGNTSTSAASGQVNGDKNLNVNGDAYFKLALDPAGAITYGWYDFVVPFEVDIVGGIYLPSNMETPLRNGYDFAIMSYDEAKRAVNGKDWNKYSGTMEPGRVYTITVDYRHGWNELVFKKKAGASLTGDRSFTAAYSGLGETVDNGWNGLGNGSLFHAELDVPEGTVVQIYDHANKCYQPHDAKDYSIAVGTSFFMQVGSVQTITLAAADDNGRFMAPARSRSAIEKFNLSLIPEDAEKAADHLWVGANEDATEAYVIGEDVLKMGTLTEANVARMWTSKGGHNLCAVNTTLANDQASTPLSLYAPKAGQYTLEIEKKPEDATLYLTYDNNIIWNLSMSPYIFDLTKGTTEGFGLRLIADAPKVTTGIEETDTDAQTMRKVIIDNKVYIVTPEGKMYDIVGKNVR